LIWKPGMSTAERVTEVSGRGVGMDIVRTRIEQLHGTIEVDSVPGEGTTFSIRLPLTLAILHCLMIEFQGEVFAVPMELVKEIVRLDGQSAARAQGHSLVRIRERVLATMRLDEAFAWQGSRSQCRLSLRESGVTFAERKTTLPDTLVIVGERGHDVGLAVDRVLGQEDVVIKSLADNYRDVPGIAGATILGNGRVALILDVPALLNMSLDRKSDRLEAGLTSSGLDSMPQ
jgi:two-component system chemotaxis sensor kinase CheA